jgi:hypothetical protein
LLDLIEWLPSGSALHSCLEAGGDLVKARKLFGWSIQEELLLALVNRASVQTYILAKVNGAKNVPKPDIEYGPRGKKPQGGKSDVNSIAQGLLKQQKGG